MKTPLVILPALLAALTATADPGPTTLRILVLGASENLAGTAAALNDTGHFDVIDTYDLGAATPEASELSMYDAILTFSEGGPAEAELAGDRLADYVDGGGRVVIASYSFTSPWNMAGRIMSPGYSPLTITSTMTTPGDHLRALVPEDPLFEWMDPAVVTYYVNPCYAATTSDESAQLLADDGNGLPMIARNSAGSVYGFNLFPVPEYGLANQNLFELFADALVLGTEGVHSGSPGTFIETAPLFVQNAPAPEASNVLAGLGLLALGARYFFRQARS